MANDSVDSQNREFLDISSKDDPLTKLLCATKKKQPKFQTHNPGPSSVLERVKHFLPELAQANTTLEERLKTDGQERLDIENTDDHDGDVVQMDLALVERSDSSDCDDSDDDTDSNDSGWNSDTVQSSHQLTEQNLKLPGSNRRCTGKACIELLDPDTITNVTGDVDSLPIHVSTVTVDNHQ